MSAWRGCTAIILSGNVNTAACIDTCGEVSGQTHPNAGVATKRVPGGPAYFLESGIDR